MISRLSDISLRAKITISFVLIVIFGTAISTLIGSQIVTRAMLNEARKQIRHGLKAAEMVYEGRIESVRVSIVGAAGTERLAAALNTKDSEALPRVLEQIRDENHLQFLSFIEPRNKRIFRASSPAIREKDSETAPVPDFINSAMSGSIMAGTELLSPEDLVREDPALRAITHCASKSFRSSQVQVPLS